MFRILVCDNDARDLRNVLDTIARYIEKHKINTIEVVDFQNPVLVKKLLEGGAHFSMYFLDIIMPEVSGIDLAQLIRDFDQEVPIVFTTSSREYAFEAFGIHALAYLEKPIRYQELEWVMQKTLQDRDERFASFKTKDGMVKVKLSDIYFAENVSRSVHLILKDGAQIQCLCNRVSFEKSLEDLLSQKDFIQTHKSYVVNMNTIVRLNHEYLELENGQSVPISRNRFSDVKKEYLKFLAEGGR